MKLDIFGCRSLHFPTKLRGTNLFNLLFKTFLQVLVAPDQFVKNLKRKTRCVVAITLSEHLFLGSDLEAFTCAYACMVSKSSRALKRQTSVEVTSSDRVPPGAESHTSRPISLWLQMHYNKHGTFWDIYKLYNGLIKHYNKVNIYWMNMLYNP